MRCRVWLWLCAHLGGWSEDPPYKLLDHRADLIGEPPAAERERTGFHGFHGVVSVDVREHAGTLYAVLAQSISNEVSPLLFAFQPPSLSRSLRVSTGRGC